MLYGISLLAGKFGTGYLPDLATAYIASLVSQTGGQVDPILVLGIAASSWSASLQAGGGAVPFLVPGRVRGGRGRGGGVPVGGVQGRRRWRCWHRSI